MLAAFISPPAPREQHHFDAILRLAVFFEDLSGVTDEALDRWIVRPRLNNLYSVDRTPSSFFFFGHHAVKHQFCSILHLNVSLADSKTDDERSRRDGVSRGG